MTLWGPAGIGKTRLLAEREAGEFPRVLDRILIADEPQYADL